MEGQTWDISINMFAWNSAAALFSETKAQNTGRSLRYVGWVPVTFTSHGGVKSADLVFEKPAEQAE